MSDRIAMVGSTGFPLTAEVGSQVVDLLRGFQDSTILTRKRPPFDVFIQHCAMILGIRCLTYDAHGGADNVERDSSLVADCTELLCFLSSEALESRKRSGTILLLEKALSANKPSRAYTVANGALVWAGEMP